MSVSTGHRSRTQAATARARAESVGEFEADIARHLTAADGHWIYGGRLPLAEVRRWVCLTFDNNLDPNVDLRCVCGQAGCVRPPHLDHDPIEDPEGW